MPPKRKKPLRPDEKSPRSGLLLSKARPDEKSPSKSKKRSPTKTLTKGNTSKSKQRAPAKSANSKKGSAIAETPKKRGAHSNAIGKSPDDYPPHKRLRSNSSKNEIVIDSPVAAAACTLLYKSHYGGGGGDNEDNDSESEASNNRKKRRGKAKSAGKCAGSAVELEEDADVIEDILVLSRNSTKSGEKKYRLTEGQIFQNKDILQLRIGEEANLRGICIRVTRSSNSILTVVGIDFYVHASVYENSGWHVHQAICREGDDHLKIPL